MARRARPRRTLAVRREPLPDGSGEHTQQKGPRPRLRGWDERNEARGREGRRSTKELSRRDTERDVIGSLRAHHFLCLTTYQGKGYSPDFVENMNRIWASARTGAIGTVAAHAQADPICHACPHLTDRGDPISCTFQSSIGARDRRMLAAMGWEENQQVSFESAMQTVHDRHGELMAKVCGGCDWVPICSQRKFTLRDPQFQLSAETQTSPGSSEGVEAPGP